jgi:hypothetical protein
MVAEYLVALSIDVEADSVVEAAGKGFVAIAGLRTPFVGVRQHGGTAWSAVDFDSAAPKAIPVPSPDHPKSLPAPGKLSRNPAPGTIDAGHLADNLAPVLRLTFCNDRKACLDWLCEADGGAISAGAGLPADTPTWQLVDIAFAYGYAQACCDASGVSLREVIEFGLGELN